ncbi:MAG: hypothetical protein PWP31_1889, partial [Clostridia bacterium]|nr:hypothetical protein [Clostridia bacterium]
SANTLSLHDALPILHKTITRDQNKFTQNIGLDLMGNMYFFGIIMTLKPFCGISVVKFM